MRAAYALIGFAWVLVIAGLFVFHRNFTPFRHDTKTVPSTMNTTFTLVSSAFAPNGNIPPRFTCDGKQVSPALSISGVPAGTKSLALIMDDPDVPKQLKPDGVFDHWVLFNIPPHTAEIPEGGSVGVAGKNGAGKNTYVGPCPPPQYEPSEHRYFFKLYALDGMLSLQEGASKNDLEKAMKGHIIAQTELIGHYKRQ